MERCDHTFTGAGRGELFMILNLFQKTVLTEVRDKGWLRLSRMIGTLRIRKHNLFLSRYM